MYIYGIEDFDINELFVLLAGLLVVTISAFLPERFTRSQTVFLLLFSFWLAVVVDQTLAVPPYDLYDIMDSSRMDVMDPFLYAVVYPASGYLYFYAASTIGFHRPFRLGLLVLGWSALTLGLEWGSMYLGVFTYQMWNLGYSALSHIFIHLLKLRVLRYVASQPRKAALQAEKG
ncbi:hypothetical protein [Gorillibacterium sp. sgz5001074]|uniref:hypothetical protein n=1 Tax=Gorillibacterium sp. sgz5001074 TaxID=3446695 RepID=UPI003F669C23